MAYTRVRFIAYQLSTVGRAVPAVYGIPTGAVANPPNLTGVTAGLSLDARRRVERLIGALLRARARVATSDNKQTLKVFMAPEFYFRPNNADLSYSMAEYRAIKKVLRETIGADARFDDWLIVPGTILWKMTAADSSVKRPITDPNRQVFFNTGMYIKKATNPNPQKSKVLEKTWASNIDGIPTGFHGGNHPIDLNKREASIEFPKYHGTAKKKKHVFTLCGLNLGLEICLEHSLQIVKGVLCDQLKSSGKLKSLNLHLLTAGGMKCWPEFVAAKMSGYVLRDDGFPPVINTPVQMLRVSAYSHKNGAANLKATAKWQDLTGSNPTSIAIAAGDDLYLAAPLTCTATWMPQQILIYPAQRLL